MAESARAGRGGEAAAHASSSTGATLEIRAMKRLIQLNVTSRQRLEATSLDENLHGADAADARHRVDERLELAVFAERAAGLPFDLFRKIDRRGRAVDARAQHLRPRRKTNRLYFVGGTGNGLDGRIPDRVVEVLGGAFARLRRPHRDAHLR